VLDIGAGGLEVVLTLSTAARLRFGCGL